MSDGMNMKCPSCTAVLGSTGRLENHQRWFHDKRYPRLMKYIKLVGSELEGAFRHGTPNVVHDGSVDVVGESTRDGCPNECSNDCSCDSCSECSLCEHYYEDCSCDECMWCGECSNPADDCECREINSKHVLYNACAKCKANVDSDENNHEHGLMCDDDWNAFTEQYHWINCNACSNLQYRCEDPRECGCCSCEGDGENFDGELRSDPMHPSELYDWVITNYPVKVNRSCGAHLHVSFKSKRDYSYLMTPEFTDYIILNLKEWGHRLNIKSEAFWERVSNDNTFCRVMYRGRQQVNQTEHYHGDRYATINYCYAQHSTLEFRVPPAFHDPELTAKLYMFLLEITCKFIEKQKRANAHKITIMSKQFKTHSDVFRPVETVECV